MTVSQNLKVRVVGVEGNKEMVFKLLPHTKMVRLKNIFADFVGVSVHQLKFFFKSREVQNGDSVDTLGMKDGDIIRVHNGSGVKEVQEELPPGWRLVKQDCLPFSTLFISPSGKIFNSLRAVRSFMVSTGEEVRSSEIEEALAKSRRELEKCWSRGELSQSAIKRRRSYQESSRHNFANLRKKTLLANAQRVRREMKAAKTLFEARKTGKRFMWHG